VPIKELLKLIKTSLKGKFSYLRPSGFFPQGPIRLLHKTRLSSSACAFKQMNNNLSFFLLTLFSFSLLGKPTGFFPLGVLGEGESLTVLAAKLVSSKAHTEVLLESCDEV
jgi:hypothetical protein